MWRTFLKCFAIVVISCSIDFYSISGLTGAHASDHSHHRHHNEGQSTPVTDLHIASQTKGSPDLKKEASKKKVADEHAEHAVEKRARVNARHALSKHREGVEDMGQSNSPPGKHKDDGYREIIDKHWQASKGAKAKREEAREGVSLAVTDIKDHSLRVSHSLDRLYKRLLLQLGRTDLLGVDSIHNLSFEQPSSIEKAGRSVESYYIERDALDKQGIYKCFNYVQSAYHTLIVILIFKINSLMKNMSIEMSSLLKLGKVT